VHSEENPQSGAKLTRWHRSCDDGCDRPTGVCPHAGAAALFTRSFRETRPVSRHRNALDGQPGSVPDIRTDVCGLTFVMRLRGTPEKLVIRCDDAGDVWVAIVPDDDPDD